MRASGNPGSRSVGRSVAYLEPAQRVIPSCLQTSSVKDLLSSSRVLRLFSLEVEVAAGTL